MQGLETAAVIFGIAGTVCGIVFGYFAFQNKKNKECEDDGKKEGSLFTEIGYIKSGVDDIKLEQREQRKTNIDVITRVTDVEASAKQAHKRLDALERNNK